MLLYAERIGVFNSLEGDWTLPTPCPYCGKEQKLTLADEEGYLKLNQAHREFCPIRKKNPGTRSFSVSGANQLASWWEALASDGTDRKLIIDVLHRASVISHKNKQLEEMIKDTGTYKDLLHSVHQAADRIQVLEAKLSGTGSYDDIIRENKLLRESVNGLSSERSKWLRKLKRAGIK
jgi:hypothetical protein